MKRFPWLTMRKKTDTELPYEPPIHFGNKSNGEYFQFATKRDRQIRKLVLEKCAENAQRLGMERRQFLASAMGMTTSLWVLNYVAGCSSSESPATTGGPQQTGKFCVPEQAMFDESCANEIVRAKNQFVFDVQTHWFNAPDLANYPAYQQQFGALFAVATEDNYINALFCNSDTTMVALTSWPGISCTATRRIGCGMPLSNDNMAASRDKINAAAGNSQRVVSHVQILPQDPSGIDEQLRIMEEYYCNHQAAAFKLYPGFKPGFKLDDENGQKVLERGLELGLNLFCIHKGLPIGNFFSADTNYPDDVGPMAKKYPDAKLIIYHSAIFAGHERSADAPPEGEFVDSDRPSGVNALIKSVVDAGLEPGPNMNVYGEMGTMYSSIMNDPTESMHVLGKLMKYLGPDNVVWGTDTMANGTPAQSQIEAFRALEIPADNQWGYPPLGPSTPEGKLNQDKILGLNAAKLYKVDPEAMRCNVDACPSAKLKEHMDEEVGPRRWVFSARNPTYQEWLDEAEMMRKTGRPG
jgi:uncharacterized protein